MSSLTVISPHPDDAAISLGATLQAWARRGVPIHVITCFTDTTWAPSLPGTPASEVRRERAREDAAFLRLLPGASHTRLRGRDIVVRSPERRRDDAIEKRDEPLIRDLARSLQRHRRPGPLLVPLGLVHLDHKLARLAALRAGSVAVAFYEDLPYCAWLSPSHIAAAAELVSRIVGPLHRAGVGRSARVRQRAIDAYRSQFDEAERRWLARVASERNGEGVWATAMFWEALSALARPRRR